MTALLRVYESGELGQDGYPFAWHRCTTCGGDGVELVHSAECAARGDCVCDGVPGHCSGCDGAGSIKALIRAQAGDRCERCQHEYRKGEHGRGEWSPCDERCAHGGPFGVRRSIGGPGIVATVTGPELQVPILTSVVARDVMAQARLLGDHPVLLARWRILTVHHLNGDKADCRWWNLAALCQRCHLTIQGRVVIERAFILEHSDWFKPHAAGFYATKYLGLDLDRDEALARMDELLGLERVA